MKFSNSSYNTKVSKIIIYMYKKSNKIQISKDAQEVSTKGKGYHK